MVAKIVITPNTGSTTPGQDPTIKYQGTGNSTDITQRVTAAGAISFEGSNGQLFSIVDSLSGTIYAVNDISGIPSIEVLDTGVVKLAQYSGNVGIGKEPDPAYMLDVNGAIRATSIVGMTNGTVTGVTGTAPVVSSGGVAPVISMAAATASVPGYMSAAYATKIDGISGTNTGDETTTTIKTKLGIATLSGSNTGDQTTVSGTAGNVTGVVAIANGGTGASNAAAALAALGGYAASNPNNYSNGYDIYNFINGKPLVYEVLIRFVTVRAFTCAINLAGSMAYCTVAATSSFMIEVLKNNVRVGTLTFSAGATTGVFVAAVAVTFNAGDQLALRCTNATADATLSDVAITIYGTSS